MERLDHEAIKEAQEQREQLNKLDIKELWERLDLLVPNDPTQDLTA
jgi:gentisate 1,2-dioxygenase